MKRLTLAMVAAALGSTSVYALEKPYVGIDYQMGTFEAAGGIEAEPSAIRLRGGTEINPYLAVEAQVGFGADSDKLAKQGVVFDVKMDSFYALFVRPQISLGSVASIYGLVGASYVDLSANSNNAVIASDDGFRHDTAFGAGLDFKVYKNVRLSVDYIEYLSEYSAISGGVRISLP